MAPARRRVSYVIPPPSDPVPRLQLPPHGLPRNGVVGPLLIPSTHTTPSSSQPLPKWAQHPRHRLGVSCLALDTSTQLVGRAAPEGILYTGGRDGLAISWDLGIPMKRRTHRYGLTGRSLRRWEVMTNWADDVIEEEADEGEEIRSDGDVLGEVTGKARKKSITTDNTIPYEEQWETDVEAYEARKSNPPSTQFRQCAQMHTDWVNDMLLCNHNQTLVTASSDGTVKAWSPHTHGHSASFHEPTTVGMHADYVRCLAHCREQQWVASGSFDRTIKLWDLSLASPRNEPLITLNPPESSGPKSSIYALATDPYGSVVASGSPERVIRMWDPRSGRRVGKLVGHTDNIRAILISEDAKYLLTGSADASIKLWSLSSQRCLHTFTHHTDSVWSLFSSHPALEIFYSGDRSGLVCKVDVESCADVSEGECIVVCQDTEDNGERYGSAGSEGINKIVAMDDNLLWTASGSSSISRWRVPPRRAVRAAALSAEGAVDSPLFSPPPMDYYASRIVKRNSLDLASSRAKSPTRSITYDQSTTARNTSPSPFRGPRISLTPSLDPSLLSDNSHATPDHELDPDREGEDTWYGIPFESLVRLTSPNDAGFGLAGPSFRGRDPEIATLYSAASIMSVPRMLRSPTQFHSQNQAQQVPPRATSPIRSDTIHSHNMCLVEETQTLHPVARVRAAYDEREVAADAVPLRRAPEEVVHGDHGLVRCVMLNDRMHALTVDTAGEVAVWDVVRCACLGRFMSEDVTAASLCGSDVSVSVAGGSGDGRSVADKDKGRDRERSPREALETVRERIEGQAVVSSWATVDTKTGVLTVHLNEKCFESEIYADEAGYGPERRFGDETRLNIGKWVLRNLFYGFIREELRHATRRTHDLASHDSSQHRLQRGGAPTHIELNGQSSDSHKRSSSDASRTSSPTSAIVPRSATIIFSPNMLPAVSPTVTTAPRSSPLMTPLIPINTTIRDSGLSPIPQSPGNSDATPMPRRSQVSDSAATPDYFTLRNRGDSLSTSAVPSSPDDFSGWGGKGSSGQDASGLQTPTTPSAGGLMGRLRAFGKSTKRQANEPGGLVTPGSALPGGESVNPPEDSVTHIVVKTPVQMLLSTPLNPPPSHEAPPLPVPPTTSVIISEEALSGWSILYRGHVSSTGGDIHVLEETMPLWLLECLLINKVPSVSVNKISFVLLPYPSKDPDMEPLPELLNTAQSKLTASRFLRVRKLTNHVQDKIDRITGAHLISNSTTPRSSFDTRSMSPGGKSRDRDHDSRPRAEDMYEVLCNDVVLPLDMTLAAVRQYVWRQAAELTMYYRRKTPNPPR